ncbi:SUMO-specific isopeptidase USPL1 [Collichthys lucidus]|uniref:SUMO-specific isopeptidase USPL1 n=1 Tax=Collichthys lucidus TaxID=240159 RepID=A0A4U5V6C2_COLLU|nr:SUMO-specific isopeptidase USPL1 [Collichthys lucidus]
MDQKSRSGEDTGLGALASPLVGYLGKVQERVALLEYCPWCTSKGLIYALRSYRINLQESISLCTNPQCLFPLVSWPLEDVLASLVPVELTVGNKRKNALALEKEELIKPARKRLRSSQLDTLGTQSITDTVISQTEHDAVTFVTNGQCAAPKTDGEKVNGYHTDSLVSGTTGWKSLQDKDDVLDEEPENPAPADGLAFPTCSVSAGHLQSLSDTLLTNGDEPVRSPGGALGISTVQDDFSQGKSLPEALNKPSICSQSFFTNEDIRSAEINSPSPRHNEQTARLGQKSPAADITTCKDTQVSKSETGALSSTMRTKSEELVPIPSQLFWRNSNHLCWLDSLLVALVNCKSLRKCKPKDEPQRSSVWRLIREYEDICAELQVHQQPDRDGITRVPSRALQKANADLQRLRMSIFKLLQPKLQCKLGQRETPVFALPLLLTMDSWVEPLFQSTFHWEFKCSECKTATKERVLKTLPSFTNVAPNWRPLNAVHMAPCNVCYKNNQRRTMMLDSVPSVFQLHFVEGLPDSDVRIYSFTFKGKYYSVTTVIQYNQQLKHFVTWIGNSDGSWLEYDDLKHPDCKIYPKLPVPAEEIHVVFWEMQDDKEPQACSPSSTFVEHGNKLNLSPEFEDCNSIMDTTVTAGVDASIGSTTLLDTFEGLSHDDIITLTLVDLKADSEMQPANDCRQTLSPDLSVPSRSEILDSAPDSSSTQTGGEKTHSPVAELPTTSNSSETEDDSSSDPTFVPGGSGGRGTGRGKAASRQTGRKAASSETAPHISHHPASSKPSKVITVKPTSAAAQDNTPHDETTQPASPVSSTDSSILSTTQNSPTVQTLNQNSRWSFLLSKHPLHQLQKPIKKHAPTPATKAKPTPLTQSTPNPVRRPQFPAGLVPKPQLRTEEGDSLPLKAAEMYGAFGAKSLSTPTPPLLNVKSKLVQPVTSNNQKLLMNTPVVSGTSLPMPAAKGLPEISSSKKHSSQSSKVPPGLSDTETLRYKLLKKLKAKKKKLAVLNAKLGHQGGDSLRPDSTDLGSPNTVTSSTYDSSICDDFLSDLLSPATTASNLSPDSSGFLERLANGQEGVDQLDCAIREVNAAPQVNMSMNEPNTESFLDDFFLQAVAQRPTEAETEALSGLELFF